MIKPDFKIDRLLFYLLLDFIFRVYIKDNATIHCLYTNWKALFFVLSKLFFKKMKLLTTHIVMSTRYLKIVSLGLIL
jgi:hypothetical protein